jgi:hypothetical protein
VALVVRFGDNNERPALLGGCSSGAASAAAAARSRSCGRSTKLRQLLAGRMTRSIWLRAHRLADAGARQHGGGIGRERQPRQLLAKWW